jgi:hypothetical protein
MKSFWNVSFQRPPELVATLVFLLAFPEWLSPALRAEGVPAPAQSCPISASQLGKMCPAELDQVFAAGRVELPPVGPACGRVLLVSSARLPRLRAQLMSSVWKGKLFFPDGSFTNLWVGGVQAVPSCVTIAPSWFDARPCIVLEYPPGSPVFANTRDEIREIAPGLFLGQFYQRCPCPKLQGYFVLEMKCP